MAKSKPTRLSREEINQFENHYSDLVSQGDDLIVNHSNLANRASVPLRDRTSLRVQLIQLDYEFARLLGNGCIVHGIRLALTQARKRCCACACCRRVALVRLPDATEQAHLDRLRRVANGDYTSGLFP